MASYEAYYEQIKNQTAADRQAAKDKSNKIFENQKAVAKDQFSSQVKETTSAYNDNYRMARIQKATNERQIAENMAKMGLTDSGLNRTQITANQLSYGNTIGKLNTALQKATDALALALRGNITTIENNRLQAEASIDNQFDKYASDAAAAMYKANVAAASRSYSGGGGAKTSSYLSKIKSSVKDNSLTESEFNKLKKTVGVNGRTHQKATYYLVNGNRYSNYSQYKDSVLQNTILGYAEKYGLSDDEIDYYYEALR